MERGASCRPNDSRKEERPNGRVKKTFRDWRDYWSKPYEGKGSSWNARHKGGVSSVKVFTTVRGKACKKQNAKRTSSKWGDKILRESVPVGLNIKNQGEVKPRLLGSLGRTRKLADVLIHFRYRIPKSRRNPN